MHTATPTAAADLLALLAALRLPSGTRRFRTCALVGSSGSLLQDRYGNEIDNHDLVLRFNNAPVAGFEPIAGKRTSIRLINSHAAAATLQQCANFDSIVSVGSGTAACPSPRNGPARCCPGPEAVLLNSGSPSIAACYRAVCNAPAVNVKTLLQNTSTVRAIEGIVGHSAGRTLLSGAYGVAVAMLLCTERVDVYGMTLPVENRTRPNLRYHYYDDCSHFETDALDATGAGIDTVSRLTQQQTSPRPQGQAEESQHPVFSQNGPLLRLVPPTSAHASWVATTGSLEGRLAAHAAVALSSLFASSLPSARRLPARATSPAGTLAPCPKRSGVRQIKALLTRAARLDATVPCCNETWPEAGKMGRCASLADAGDCDTWRTVCPVACAQCRVCPNSPALPSYTALFARMALPPLPHLYNPVNGSRENRLALSKALQGVEIFASSAPTARAAPKAKEVAVATSSSVADDMPTCTCFSTCDLPSAADFRSSIPDTITDPASPWMGYLTVVYGRAPTLPFELSRLNFFYHNDRRWNRRRRVPWPMATCRKRTTDMRPLRMSRTDALNMTGFWRTFAEAAPAPRCEQSHCEKWLRPRRDRLTTSSQDAARGSGVDHIVLVTNAEGGSRGVILFGGRGSLAPLHLGSTGAGATRFAPSTAASLSDGSLGRRLHASRAMVEVMRMDETAINPAMRPAEGTRGTGCWFFPAEGSGVWLDLGRTWTLRHKLEAVGQPPFEESGPRDLLSAFLSRQPTLGLKPRLPRPRETTKEVEGTMPRRLWSSAARDFNRSRPYHPSRWPLLQGGAAALRAAVAELPLTTSRAEKFPALAYALGVDSVQVQSMAGSDTEALPSELVVTRSSCVMSVSLLRGGCVAGSLLRSGYDGAAPCACDATDVALNCDADAGSPSRPPVAEVVSQLRARRLPFVVVPRFWNASRAAAARVEVRRALTDCHEINEDGGDRRRLGLDAQPHNFPLAADFGADPYLRAVAKAFLQPASFNTKVQAGLTRPGESSGGGWHRDTRARGIKALLYLDDVGPRDGPFAMLLGYDERTLQHAPDPLGKGRVTRYNDSAIAEQVRRHGATVQPVHAEAGALILFEISSVHRGTPCERGERAVLTNYYKVRRASTVCPAR